MQAAWTFRLAQGLRGEIDTMRISPIVLLLVAMLGCGLESQTANESDSKAQEQDVETNVENKSSPATLAVEPVETREQAIAVIKKMGGKVTFDEMKPDRPVERINFSRSEITDAGLEHLKGLTSLQTLKLNDTQITDAGLEHLKGLTELKYLNVNETKITDTGLMYLKGLTNLQGLDLTDTTITDAGLEHLKGLTKLFWLQLAFTNVTDEGLKHLKEMTILKILDLSFTNITDEGLEHLKGLTKLQLLNLNDKVTDEGVQKLRQALPNCEINH